MTTCPQCGGSVAEGVSFCQYCGTALKTAARGPICSDCGTRNPPGTNFCYTCGARVAAGAATSVVPLVKSSPPSGGKSSNEAARLITVRRDGTDGEAFAIGGEQMDIGR